MARRLVLAIGMSTILIVGSLPAAAVARSPEASGLRRLDAATLEQLREIPGLGPRALRPRQRVAVIVSLQGRPVAAIEADTLRREGRRLSVAERRAFGRDVAARQRAVEPAIAALGGRVRASYRHALNGLRVSVPYGRLAELAGLPGVAGVHAIARYTPGNTQLAGFVQSPKAWAQTGRTGNGVTIAIIDTGIDYTHAHFGGSGNPAAFDADDGLDRTTGTPFPTTKVIEGWDFAGDAYDAGDPDNDVPVPDDDPIDCNGHGTHVAGTAAGTGVKKVGATESTYTGAYNTTTLSSNAFVVGPGVAPRAKLVALKIFGCDGSTDLVVDAIDRAVELGVDVINMSLGSEFTRGDDATAQAVDNAADAGIVVVGSAGNEGPSAYIHGGVTAGDKGISVAAIDGQGRWPTAKVQLSPQPNQAGLNMNASLNLPRTALLTVLPGSVGMGLGCSGADYAGFVPGRIAVVRRGNCTLVEKGELAQAAGATGIVVVNDFPGLMPYLGPSSDFFTIPMIGLPSASKNEMVASHGTSATLKADSPFANPDFKTLAAFTSGGPRNGDSALKPDITAPGMNVASAAMGKGTGAVALSGTSMASPVVAGAAALVIEARPTWSALDVKSVLMGTAQVGDNKFVSGEYDVRLAGPGVVNAFRAASSVAFVRTPSAGASLSFGYDQISGAYTESRSFEIVNRSKKSITYSVSTAFNGPSYGATMVLSHSSRTVPAKSSRTVTATLKISATNVRKLPGALALVDVSDGGLFFQTLTTVKGVIKLTPTTAATNRYTLRVPFLSVPRGVSNIWLSNRGTYSVSGGEAIFSGTLSNTGVTNHKSVAELYAWGLADADDGLDANDIRAVGVQGVECGDPFLGCAADDRLISFAVNTWGRWSNPSTEEFDVLIDVDDDEAPDFAVFTFDAGLVETGQFDGTPVVITCELDAEEECDEAGFFDGFFLDGVPDGSTAWLPTVGSWLGLDDTAGHLQYGAASANVVPSDYAIVDLVADESGENLLWAPWNPWAPAVNTGDAYLITVGSSTGHVFRASYANIAAEGAPLGWLLFAIEDANDAAQADLIPLGTLP